MKFIIPWHITVNATILAGKSGFVLSVSFALLDDNVMKLYTVIIKTIYHEFNSFIIRIELIKNKNNVLYFF